MDIEEFEYSNDINNNDNNYSPRLIHKKKHLKKESKFNFNCIPNKKITIAIYSFFLIAVTLCIILNLIYNNKINVLNSLENSSKDTSNKLPECDIGYKLQNNECVINYSFKALYETYKDIEQIDFAKTLSPEMILELIIDGEKKRPNNKFVFQNKGKHLVYILLDMNKIDTLENMFSGNIYLSKISFSEIFNIEKFISMKSMFRNCRSLTNIDLSKVKTKNIINMDLLFSGCTSLIDININNFSNENLIS